MSITRPTIMEIDVKAFEYNLEKIKEYVGNNVKVMPVIKANAYGTQINKRLDIINKFDIVAVAIVDEGVELRKLGYTGEIFVLNQPYESEIEKIIVNNITIGISSNSFIERLGEYKEDVNVHIEIGTGMGRTGIHPDRATEYIEKVKKYSNIKIEGIYTHLSSADISIEYTKQQLKSLQKAVDEIIKIIPNIKYIHSGASNGILNFKESYYNLVRPGIILYGYESEENTYKIIDLKPVAKLKSKIILLKTVRENTSIGYARSFITKRESKIATIPIGYADGMPRSLSNKGHVIINGQKAPIIGNICMDTFMIDVTDIENVNVGDDVYIWDNEKLTLEEVAFIAGTINYEILSRISYRVPRVFN